MKKNSLVVIALLLIISLVGCSGKSPNNQNDSNSEPEYDPITLAYCINDVINPYTSVTEVNQKLSNLLFDSLITLDDSYSIINVLASSVTLDDKACTVTIKPALFSDGSKLTASDVIYSADCAKESGKYATLFSAITSITALNESTVVFNLKKTDRLFTALLTFPIIKNGTADLKTENNLSLPPVGCGKYVPDFDNLKLLRNENYHSEKPLGKVINLANIPDHDALSYALLSGKISVWNDDYDGAETLVANGGTVAVTSNNLIYLGINSSNKILSIPQMRYALSAIIDRNTITNNVFGNYAKSSSGIFNPSWYAVSDIQENIDKQNTNIYLANLEEIGYNRLDSSGFRLTKDGKSFSFKLVYCNDTRLKSRLAEELASQFSKAGIKIELVGLTFEEYITALESKKFDLYLAETVISDNMDISSIVCEGGKLNFGGTFDFKLSNGTNDKVVYTKFNEIISAYASGNSELYDIINMFNLQMPIIPICYKSNALSYQSGISSSWLCSPCDPYYMIKDCVIK